MPSLHTDLKKLLWVQHQTSSLYLPRESPVVTINAYVNSCFAAVFVACFFALNCVFLQRTGSALFLSVNVCTGDSMLLWLTIAFSSTKWYYRRDRPGLVGWHADVNRYRYNPMHRCYCLFKGIITKMASLILEDKEIIKERNA